MASVATAPCITLRNGMEMPVLGWNTYQNNELASLKTCLETAFNAGYRLVDSALLYGNEAALGNAMAELMAEGCMRREDLFLVSKLPVCERGQAKEQVRRRIDRTLGDLKVSHLDLYVIHSPVCKQLDEEDHFTDFMKPIDSDLEGTWRELESLVDEGKVRALGLSNCNTHQLGRITDMARHKPVNIQVEAHVYLQQKQLLDYCRERDITVTAYSPLGAPESPEHTRTRSEHTGLRGTLYQNAVVSLVHKYKKTPSQVLLRHLVDLGMAIVPKSNDPEELKEYAQLFDFKLDDGDLEGLVKLDCGRRYNTLAWCPTDHPEYPFKDEIHI